MGKSGPARRQRIEDLYHQALQRDAQHRAAFLDDACRDDTQLRTEIEMLLRHGQDAEEAGFMQPWARRLLCDSTSAETQSSASDSRRIGPFKLLQQIGEGGMGTVWMAEQQEPVSRRVALKVIKAGMDSKQVLARFEAERQALAMMDHQNIAKVLDAGMSVDGLPYFAMELVKGIPINEYCDQNRLTPAERLELFVPVCQAIQHAHQKGIVHRDLKPSNVLVTLYDGKPVPKVIDFGLAKALEHQLKLTDKTLFTDFGQVVGTVQYMSPEQAEMNALDVDTRTDVYSLGVMLYELLAGSTPMDRETLDRHALMQLLRVVKEVEPPRPSVRLSESGDAIADISQQRNIEPKRLQSLLRGELDWIVMKALEKDRVRRYETPRSFAEDVARFLNGEPIVAKPPSRMYRLTKKLARHKVVVGSIAGTAIVVGLLAVAIVWPLSQLNSVQPAGVENGGTAPDSGDIVSDTVDRFGNSVVRIQSGARHTRHSLGSGFLVEQDGLLSLVTNAHVLAGVREATVHIGDGIGTSIEIEGTYLIDEEKDICVAKINAARLSALPLTNRLPKTGEIVIALGYPEFRPVLATRGLVVGMRSTFGAPESEEDSGPSWIAFSAVFSEDFSGGPLIDGYGQVVGMCSFVEEDRGEHFGISAGDILDAIAIAKESDLVPLREGVAKLHVVTVLRNYVGVPIEYRNLSDQLLFDEKTPAYARVTLSGQERHFRFFDKGNLRISIDLSNAHTGLQQIPIEPQHLGLPTNLKLYRIEPRTIRLNLEAAPADM